jgi:hypothetical protein
MQADAANSIEEQKQRILRIELRLQNAEDAGNVQLMETYAKMLMEATKDLAAMERSMLRMVPMTAAELPALFPPPFPSQAPEAGVSGWAESGILEAPPELPSWSAPPLFGDPAARSPTQTHPPGPMPMASSRPPVMKPAPSDSVLPLSVATALGDSLGQTKAIGHSAISDSMSVAQSRNLSQQLDHMEYLRLNHSLLMQVMTAKNVAVKSEGWASELPSNGSEHSVGGEALHAPLPVPASSAPAVGEWESTLCHHSGFGAVLLKTPENSSLLTFSPHQWPILLRRGSFLPGELAPFIVQQLKMRIGAIEPKPIRLKSDGVLFDDLRSLIRSMELVVALLGKKSSTTQESEGSSGRPSLAEGELNALNSLDGLASVARGWLVPIAEAVFLSVGGVASTEYPPWLMAVATSFAERRSQPSSPNHDTPQDGAHSRKRARIT